LDIAVATDGDNATRLNPALSEVGLMKADYGGIGTSFETRYGRRLQRQFACRYPRVAVALT
jgi:hypothetical protein